MDIKPTKEKKKKKVSKKRANEIHRRRASVLRNSDRDQSENLLVPKDVPLLTQSAPGSRRESGTELSDIETFKEAEEDKEDNFKRVEKSSHPQNEDGSNVKMEDLWKQTIPIAIIENTWKAKARRGSMRRRSSGGSESDAKAALDKLRIEKTVNVIKKKTTNKPTFFWDEIKANDEADKPEP